MSIDAAGNEAVSDVFTVGNIDKVAPTLLGIDMGAPSADGVIAIALTPSETLAQLLFSWKESEWVALAGETLTVAENGTVRFRLVDLAGNETLTETYTVDGFATVVTEVQLQETTDGTVIDWSGDATAAWVQQYDVALVIGE